MDVWTKFEVGQRVLQLLIGNEKVTDGQTDRPTCAKQYALSSSKGGHKNLRTRLRLEYKSRIR